MLARVPVEPAVQLNEGFSEPGAAAPPWAEVTRMLSASEMVWLSTVRCDRRPHVTPLSGHLGRWEMYFCVGSHEKAKNLDSDGRCVLAADASQFRSGLDVVIEELPSG